MDRFYTSPELFDELKKLNIGACVHTKYIVEFINRVQFNGEG